MKNNIKYLFPIVTGLSVAKLQFTGQFAIEGYLSVGLASALLLGAHWSKIELKNNFWFTILYISSWVFIFLAFFNFTR